MSFNVSAMAELTLHLEKGIDNFDIIDLGITKQRNKNRNNKEKQKKNETICGICLKNDNNHINQFLNPPPLSFFYLKPFDMLK